MRTPLLFYASWLFLCCNFHSSLSAEHIIWQPLSGVTPKHVFQRFSMINLKRKSFSWSNCHNIGNSQRISDLWHLILQASNKNLHIFSLWQVLLAAFPYLSSSASILLLQQLLGLHLTRYFFSLQSHFGNEKRLETSDGRRSIDKGWNFHPKTLCFLVSPNVCTAADNPFTRQPLSSLRPGRCDDLG